MSPQEALEILKQWQRQNTSLRLVTVSPEETLIERWATVDSVDSSKLAVRLASANESEDFNLTAAKFGHLVLPECPTDSSAGALYVRLADGNIVTLDEKLVFVKAEYLGFDLVALIDSAMADWRLEQMAPVESFNESCGDFIVDAMERYGLRNLGSEEATFSREAKQEQFRECVFSAMDHWLIRGEIDRQPSEQKTDAYTRPLGE